MLILMGTDINPSWFGQASGYALMVFILWSGIIKSPPLWVTFREHRRCQDSERKWEDAALRGTALADVATRVIERKEPT